MLPSLVGSEFSGYSTAVKSSAASNLVCLVVGLWLLLRPAQAEPKWIRLRNESIRTEPSAQAAALRRSTVDRPVSGLFLVQFHDRLQPGWKEQLQGLGVELLRYVPDNAFIVRAQNVNLEQVRALDFVRWAGEYRPDHKIHPAVGQRAAQAIPGEAPAISILFSPAATSAEVAGVRGLLQNLAQESHSRFGAVLRGRIPLARLAALAESPAVLWIEPGPRIQLYDEIAAKIVGGDGGPGVTFTQSYGFDGTGVTVAVADSGLHFGMAANMHPDLAGRVSAFFYYGALTDAADEHSHGTHVAGIIAGNGATGEKDETGALYGLGVASGATVVAQRIFDGAGNYEPPPTSETLTRDAVRAGAVIGSNSWGDDTQGRYDISAAEFDALVRDADGATPGDQPYILEFSAGNAGPGLQTIGSPAVAKNVIATGASENDRFDFFIYADGQDTMADFSSRGPCEDGRIKPDVVAPGTWIASLRSPLGDDENAWAPISEYYLYQGGTSQAGPQVSAAAAVFVQYYREIYGLGTPSPALVKAALINSAHDMAPEEAEVQPTPNMDEGWGRVDLTALILPSRSYEFVDQTDLLRTGQVYERRVILSSSLQPLVLTLAYTDVPGFPGAIPALVNDLDLEVIAPDGATYRGNQFRDGESVPGSASPDTINNVEGIYLSEPLPGEYVVRVRASNVVQDARRDTAAVDQDFALVISGGIPAPGTAIVILDRGAYTAPSRIGIKLIDSDLAAQPLVNVTLQSTTDQAGETVVLRPAGSSGVYTGSVATVTGPAVAGDGRLQIVHLDVITATYQDPAAGARTATAVADLLPPVITVVSATNQFGQMVVSWTTDEPAGSIVRFGTNSTLGLTASQSRLVTEHEVELTNLVASRTYFFKVSSTDAAGNSATNDSGGKLYSFVAVPSATVLVVDAYIDDPESAVIPVETYTDTLAQIGVSYDVWNVARRGTPNVGNLRSYRIVMWRINDSFNRSGDTLTTAQQSVIQQYLAAGGAFFMSSMDILTRLGPVPFRTNVLQVQQFLTNPNFFERCSDCDEDFGVPTVEGAPTDPLARGFMAQLDYSAYPDFLGLLGPDFSDTFKPTTNAASVLLEFSSGKPCGLKYPRTGLVSTGRVVFFSFPLDAVPAETPAPNNRAGLLRQALQFLAPGLGGFGTLAMNKTEYSVPDQVTVELADSDLAGQGQTTVQFSSTTDSVGLAVTLHETVVPGLYRGSATLVPANNPPASGHLRARHGDVVTAAYQDGSANVLVTVTATVDIEPPLIASVSAAPEYEESVISWETDELTDALVQVSESPLNFPVNRVGYVADLDFVHEVRLSGLVPDRLYYYQVVSRDAAGNAAVDDNGGHFYTFHTLRPLVPPYADNLEAGGAGWTTYNGDDSQATWALGVPHNGPGATAHSPVNAWGSSLNGDFLDTADTFLISPALDLTSGNRGTLRFWHKYDFSERPDLDLLELGEVVIVTNILSPAVVLEQFSDISADWEEAEIDLTPYWGHVVFLVWHYQLSSFDPASRPGWLVDDISVETETVTLGALRITNNLAQARFVLSGPLSRTGQGVNTVVSNAGPGQYVVTFGNVPFYRTPPPQTNDLQGAELLVFFGHYNFDDENHNGMSDAWEQQYFGAVVGERTAQTDTDHDGSTDYAEFIAGTNPQAPDSKLALLPPFRRPDGALQLEWPSVAGRIYRVEGSRNAVVWIPVSDWIQASGATTTFSWREVGATPPFLFRLEVRP